MSQRNLQKLEKAIEKAEKADLVKKLGLQMQMAYRIRDQVLFGISNFWRLNHTC